MCKVVHRISVPLCSCAVVRNLDNAVDDRIAEMHVGVSHVYLCAKHHAAFHSLGCVHLVEQLKALLHRTVAIRRSHARCCRCALLLSNLFCCLLVNVSVAVLDHPHGKFPQLLKIVGSVIDVAPLESKPLDVVQDILHILCVLLARIGVIETQVTHAVIVVGHSKVHAYSFCVSDVQIAVRLWRESCLYASRVLAFFKVFLHNLFYKANALFLFFGSFFLHSCIVVFDFCCKLT